MLNLIKMNFTKSINFKLKDKSDYSSYFLAPLIKPGCFFRHKHPPKHPCALHFSISVRVDWLNGYRIVPWCDRVTDRDRDWRDGGLVVVVVRVDIERRSRRIRGGGVIAFLLLLF